MMTVASKEALVVNDLPPVCPGGSILELALGFVGREHATEWLLPLEMVFVAGPWMLCIGRVGLGWFP